MIPAENRKWYRLGTAIAFFWAAFVVVLLLALEWNLFYGLVFATVVSVVFGIAFTYFVLYVY
ncbi:hypothetical protein AArcSl_1065 [Halalkaliarchaeum desulfuricum]|uniref:Uncharacterized protein n=2 Tax=Halalkaliarchaeum desulfuricum TaxID=2055893 RepID=A0A343THX8_9EURY|nr:hypothetical protein AArcSl_1065 [Halalkaliarchaeum desulfuricum]